MTTQQKKQEAVQVGQVMAQYVRAAPASALKVSLDMLSKAFDDFMISKEDWDSIEAEVAQMAQSQQGGAPGQAAGRWSAVQPAMPDLPQPGAPQAGGGMQVAAACSAGVATATTTCSASDWSSTGTGCATSSRYSNRCWLAKVARQQPGGANSSQEQQHERNRRQHTEQHT